MSDLLSQASLVMIPSGYKEDVVYSPIPTNGSGDLSFTRASNGTRINSAGLVEVVPWNLCDYSEDQTQWTSQNATTVTANSTTAPNGTLTADTVTPTAVNDDHYRGIGLSSQVGELTAFIYVKPNGYNFFDWGIWNGSNYLVRATFDLVNLTYTFTNAGTATIESVGNGWLKCGISGSNASLSTIDLYYRVRPTGGTGAFTGNGTSGGFIWGGQLNIGSTAKPYFPTTDRLNVPRLTYQNGGGGCPSLLLEKQSTNLVTYSEQFDDAAWAKISANGGTTPIVTANYATSPDGTQNADRIQLSRTTTNGSYSYVYQSLAVVSSTVYTWSVWLKSLSGTPTIIIAYSGSSYNNTVTLTTEWARYDLQITTVGGSVDANFLLYEQVPATSLSADFLAWGFQVEQSSYETSYIPTTSASATRVADVCSKTGIGALIGGTSGTVFFDIKTNPVLSGSQYKQFCYYLNSAASQSYLYLDGSNKITTNSNWGSLFYNTALQPNTRYKVALVFAPNDFALYVNGVSVATASSGTPNDNVNLQIGQFNGSEMCEFVFNQYTHFPSRLTNTELASLTTI